MTIKELYEEAQKLGREDWEISVFDCYGSVSLAHHLDWGTSEESGEVMILP